MYLRTGSSILSLPSRANSTIEAAVNLWAEQFQELGTGPLEDLADLQLEVDVARRLRLGVIPHIYPILPLLSVIAVYSLVHPCRRNMIAFGLMEKELKVSGPRIISIESPSEASKCSPETVITL